MFASLCCKRERDVNKGLNNVDIVSSIPMAFIAHVGGFVSGALLTKILVAMEHNNG